MTGHPVVLFDVGQTLVGPNGSYAAVYVRVLAELGLELEAGLVERSIRETSVEAARLVPPGGDRFSYFAGGERPYWLWFVGRVLRGATGRGVDPEFASRALDRLWVEFGRAAAWRVYEDAVPTLEALRAEGRRLGVVSNWDSRLPRLLETLGLAHYFEVLGVSHLEGVEKPDPALFHRVLQRMGARPGDALHVGNEAALDVAGARAAGIPAVLIDRRGVLGPRRTDLDSRAGARVAGPVADGGLPWSTIGDLREVAGIARRGWAGR